MEILQKGIPGKKYGKTYQFKCGCGCRFNAQFPHDFALGNYSPYWVAYCPNCNNVFHRGFFARMRYYFSKRYKK